MVLIRIWPNYNTYGTNILHNNRLIREWYKGEMSHA